MTQTTDMTVVNNVYSLRPGITQGGIGHAYVSPTSTGNPNYIVMIHHTETSGNIIAIIEKFS